MLYTNLTHLETAEDLERVVLSEENLLVVCGNMGTNCVPVYRIAESLEPEYRDVKFCDMEFDNPESAVLRNLPETPEFLRVPLLVFFRKGRLCKVTAGNQSVEQIAANLNELFLKTEKI